MRSRLWNVYNILHRRVDWQNNKNRQPTTTATQCLSEVASAAAAALVATEPLNSTKTTDADTAITDWRVSTTRTDDDGGGNAGRRARSDSCRSDPTVTSRAAQAWSGRHSVTPTPGYGHITHPRPPPTGASIAPDHFFGRQPPVFLRVSVKRRCCTARKSFVGTRVVAAARCSEL